MKIYTMAILVVQLLTVSLIIEGTLGDEGGNCGSNEDWSACGTACPMNCGNRNTAYACIALCVPGCFCRENYVRKFNKGPCIPIQDCPAA